MDMFSIVIMEMISQVHTNIKSYLIVHFKHMLHIVHKLYSKADVDMEEGVLDLYPTEGASRLDLPLVPCSRWRGL